LLITKSAALDWAKQGVRVNSVDPGFVDTLMLEQAAGSAGHERDRRDDPDGWLARPEEIAALVPFLASDEVS
jgi:NAD(P)-dependent dehydrogenase (short-subunit alcohol dehydrogenase family)